MLYAIDAATGQEKWKKALGGISSIPVVHDEIVYTGANSSSLGHPVYAININTGDIIWTYQMTDGGYIFANPAYHGKTIFLSTELSGNLHALDALNSDKKWEFKAVKEDGYGFSPTIANNIVYHGLTNSLYALDASNGSEKWKFTYNHEGASTSVSYPDPIVENGVVYAATGQKIYAVDANSGLKKWERKLLETNLLTSAIVYFDGTLYVSSNDRNVYAIEAATGATKWKYYCGTGTPRVQTPAIVDRNGNTYYSGGSGERN